VAETDLDKLLGLGQLTVPGKPSSSVLAPEDTVAAAPDPVLPPEPSASTTPLDDLLQQDEASRAANLRSTLVKAQETDPDKQAEIEDLSARSGISPGAVERNLDEVKRQQQATELDKLLSGAPSTAAYLSEGSNAELASDSVPQLSDVEARTNSLRLTAHGGYAANLVPFATGVLEQYVAPAIGGVGALYGVVGRALASPVYASLEAAGFPEAAAALRGARSNWVVDPEAALIGTAGVVRDVAEGVDEFSGVDRNSLLTQVEKGVAQVGAQIAVAIYTGGASAAVTGITLLAQGADQMSEDIKETGAEQNAATDSAIVLGAATTAILEKWGLGRYLDKIPMVKSKLGRILAGATTEFTEEFAENVAQNLLALALYDDEREWDKGALEEATPASIVGALIGAVTPGKVAIRSREKADELHKAIQGSPLTERSPEAAAAHLESVMEKAAISDLYISAKKLAEVDPEGELLGVSAERVQEQLTLGGDVQLDTRQKAKLFIDPEAYPKLAEHLRWGADALTEAEAKDLTGQEAVQQAAQDYEQKTVGGAQAQDGDPLVSRDTKDVSPETEREVTLAEEQMGLQAMFRTAKEAGMTEPAYKNYLLAVDRAKDQSRIKQEKARFKEAQAKLSTAYQAAFAEERQSVEESVRQEPVYAALDAIGLDRLDPKAVAELLPDEQGAALIKQLPKVGGRSIVATKTEGGIHPDVLAERFGFPGGDVMLFQMAEARPVNDVIFERTEAVVAQKHPEMVQELKGIDSAIESLHDDVYSDVLAYELNALRAARKQGALKPALLRAEARRRLGAYKLSEVDPAQFLRVERQKAKEAGQLIRGKPKTKTRPAVPANRDAAARAKFQQLMNFEMAKAAYDARAKMMRQRRELAKMAKPGKEWKSVDADYVDGIKERLSQVNLMPPMTEKRRGRMMDAAKDMASKKGSVFVVPPLVLANDERVPFGSLTLDEWNQLYLHIKNAEAQGRLAKMILKGREYVELGKQRDEMLATVASLKDTRRAELRRTVQNPSGLSEAKSFLAGIDAALVKVEFMMIQLDNGVPLGPWHQTLFQPVADAQTAELDMMYKHFKPLLTELEKLASRKGNRLGEKITIAGLGGRQFTRGDIIAMALNVGNESNYSKMLEGSKKDPDGAAPWTNEGIDEALAHLDADEAKWVQKVWDAFETIYPQIEAIYRRENGISPKRVEPREVTLGGEKLKGGYFPMMYDAKRSPEASSMRIETALDAMQSPVVRASVFSGMTEERTGYSAPVLLDLRKLTFGFQQVSHFTTHYEAVRSIRKVLEDSEINKAVRAKLGPEYHKEMTRWLDDVATAGMKQQDFDQFDGVVQYLRTGVTTAIMGFSVTTKVSQLFGYATSIAVLGRSPDGKFSGRTGADWMSLGAEQYLRNPARAERDVTRLSGEMRHRMANTDRELAHAMDRISRQSEGLPSKSRQLFLDWNRASLKAIGGTQFYAVDIPTWIAGYNKGLYEGMTEADAVNYADSVLRTSQATGHEKDLSHLQRRKGFARVVTMFSSYTMLLYNLMRQTGRDARKVKNLPDVTSRMVWLVVVSALADAALRSEWPKEPDEPESWAKWFAVKNASYAFRAVQSGQIQSYALAMLIGVFLIIGAGRFLLGLY